MSSCISSASRFAARAFASPNIASPKTFPVNLPSLSSSRVAITRIITVIPRAASPASMARAAPRANGSSVPLISTISCPCFACHATVSIAGAKKVGTDNRGLRRGGADACPSAWWPSFCREETFPSPSSHASKICKPRRYILLHCKISLIPHGISRSASINQKNSSSRESPGGTATFERTSAHATAAPRASHPNQKTPLPLRSSPLPHLLPFSPQPPFALSHRLLLRALLSPHRPDISRDVFPPFH